MANGQYQYIDDAGHVWRVKLSADKAAAGGFADAPPENLMAIPWYGHPNAWMRYIRFEYQDKNGDKKRGILFISRPDNPLYTFRQASFTYNGFFCVVTCRHGEFSLQEERPRLA